MPYALTIEYILERWLYTEGLKMRCENSDYCSFYKSNSKPGSERAQALKSRYCMGDSWHCALYYVMYQLSQGFILPDDHSLDKVGGSLMEMTPTDHSMARGLIEMMSLPEALELSALMGHKGREAPCVAPSGQHVS